MSDQSDSQNKSEEQVNLSEGTSPSSSYDEGSRSTPSNLPKVATRTRKKRNINSEDEDYVSAKEEVKSKKKEVIKKEFDTATSTKPDLNKKAPAERVPMSKVEPPLLRLPSQLKRLPVKARRRKKGSRRLWPKSLGDHL